MRDICRQCLRALKPRNERSGDTEPEKMSHSHCSSSFPLGENVKGSTRSAAAESCRRSFCLLCPHRSACLGNAQQIATNEKHRFLWRRLRRGVARIVMTELRRCVPRGQPRHVLRQLGVILVLDETADIPKPATARSTGGKPVLNERGTLKLRNRNAATN